MLMAPTTKNKVSFIDGTCVEPWDVNAPLFFAWQRCNTMVLSWLLNVVSNEIVASVLYLNYAEEVWIDLRELFTQSNGSRIFQLKKSITSLSQDQMTVSACFQNPMVFETSS